MGTIKDRMVEDLRLKGYSPATRRAYVQCAQRFVAYFMRPPTALGAEEVREFLLELSSRGRSASTVRVYGSALKFLYEVTLRSPEVVAHLLLPRTRSRVPEVLSGAEVRRLFAAMRQLKYQAIAKTMYGSGLRVSEVCRLELRDIDADRMLLRVREGKGGVDRFTVLPASLLRVLRTYWSVERPVQPYLFPSSQKPKPLDTCTVQVAIRAAAKAAGLAKHVTPHTLRHTFATHMLAMGTDIRQLQVMLGHRSIQATVRYTRVSKRYLESAGNPLDILTTPAGAALG